MSNKNTRSNTKTVPFDNIGLEYEQYVKLSSNEKVIISIIFNKIDEINSKFTAALIERDEKIKSLEKQVASFKTANEKLENKFDDYEAMSRGNTLIVSGTETPISNGNEDCAAIARNLIRNKLNYRIQDTAVTSAYRIGSPPVSQKPDRRSILVKLDNENTAQTLVKTSKQMKPPNLYFSENLIPKRHGILQILRKLKKENPSKFSGCSAIRGRIYAWLKPPNPDQPGARNSRILINTRRQLEDFCVNVVEVSFDSMVTNSDFL